jgi:septal ring factor EnvC (AmiA/AmiB activator)
MTKLWTSATTLCLAICFIACGPGEEFEAAKKSLIEAQTQITNVTDELVKTTKAKATTDAKIVEMEAKLKTAASGLATAQKQIETLNQALTKAKADADLSCRVALEQQILRLWRLSKR